MNVQVVFLQIVLSPLAGRDEVPPRMAADLIAVDLVGLRCARSHPTVFGPGVLARADTGEPVEAGRKSLGRWWSSYPWYDARTDGIRRVKVSKPWDWSWLRDWLDWLGDPSRQVSWASTILRWLAWSALAIALLALAYWARKVYWQRWGGGSATEAAAAYADPANDRRRLDALPLDAHGRPSDFLAEARRLHEQGEYSQAVVYLFGHQLLQLDKHQLIRLERGKTNRQYLRELGPRVLLQRLLSETMVAFEDAFFGNYRLDRERFESCWSRLADFQGLLAEEAK